MQSKLYEFLKTKRDTKLLVVKNSKEAKIAEDLCQYIGLNPYVLSDFRAIKGDDLRSYKEELQHILIALNHFYTNKNTILISPIKTLCYKLPKKTILKNFHLSFADTINLKKFKTKLIHWGYTFVDIVQTKGEVSFRGEIIDIFTLAHQSPHRILLFDDEIESIREFVCETQKSIKDEIETIKITPALFALDEKQFFNINEKIENSNSNSFFKDMDSLGLWYLDELSSYLTMELQSIFVNDLSNEIDEIQSFSKIDKNIFNLPIVPESKIYKDIEPVDINALINYHKDKKIKILAKNSALLKKANIKDLTRVQIIQKDLIVNILGVDELIISVNRYRNKKRAKKSKIIIDDLKSGDYIVHENYGIGIFEGLENRRILGATRDFVVITYQGDDKLLLPVENLSLIDRYIASGGVGAVDKLGKGSFTKLKAKVKEKLFKIAQDIVDLAAKRELIKAQKIVTNLDEIKSFQKDAGFEYTIDQKKSIDEIFQDFNLSKPMDRLLSGDVGFGKTEVAMNALFATAKSGFNSLLLAPTTLLVSQHFKTLKQRFNRYNIIIAKLDRFTTAKEKKDILKNLKEGNINICVGTHALFNIEVKNLSLVIIDEEHKFGVKQKEKIKNFRDFLHILSMSATPIPRSLNLALSAVKGYSIIATPPSERQGVRTFVKEYDEVLLKEVILRELRRGGQLFFIHNRIETIEAKRLELLDILPELKIITLHSKISPAVTEREIMNFENGKYDMLISTSIIESGIHIPNVNTIIIEGADRFGIADLHQLRGRVGRESREGYCYYIVENKELLSEQSKKRLIALETNSFLGSGAVLAYHDLEIRGGGNIIGEAQSGHLKNIGYNLYLKMLEDAINILLNKKEVEKKENEIKLNIDAYLNNSYITEDRIRLELYRRLSLCQKVNDVYEIEEEMIDRFGKMDTTTKQFLDVIVIKILAMQKNIKTISNYQQNITLIGFNDTKFILKSPSKDDDDIIETVLKYLR